MSRKSSASLLCPCGSGQTYARCCQVFHQGALAPDAECLMRSRYSAYVLEYADYLFQTWHPDFRPSLEELQTPSALRWFDLRIQRFQPGGDQAEVEFVARYKINGRAYRLHENSRFVCCDGRWLYTEGEIFSA